jgi:hypothetical protein
MRSGSEEPGEHGSHDLRIDHVGLTLDDQTLRVGKARRDCIRCLLEVLEATRAGCAIVDRRSAGGGPYMAAS